MRVHDATRIYPLGRNKIYNLMNAGVLPFTKVGQTTILSTAGLEALVVLLDMTELPTPRRLLPILGQRILERLVVCLGGLAHRQMRRALRGIASARHKLRYLHSTLAACMRNP
jgi:hypothetical protein